MGRFFGCGKPRIKLYYSANPSSALAGPIIDLPDPAVHKLELELAADEIKNRAGKRIRTRFLGYYFIFTFQWTNVSQASMTKLVRIANHDECIVLQPHREQPLISFEVSVEQPTHKTPKDRRFMVDIFELVFKTIHPHKIRDYDTLIQVQPGYRGYEYGSAPSGSAFDDLIITRGAIFSHVNLSYDLAIERS